MAVERSKAARFASLAWRVRVPVTYTASQNKLRQKTKDKKKPYLEGLLLTHQHTIHTLIQLLRRSLRVGNLITSTNLLAQALLEIRLRTLVLLDLALQVARGDIDLSLDARIAGAGGLLDALEQIAQVAEAVVDLVLDVVDGLAGGLVFLLGAGVQEGVLGSGQLALAFSADIRDAVVDFFAFVQDAGGAAAGGLLGHFWLMSVKATDMNWDNPHAP